MKWLFTLTFFIYFNSAFSQDSIIVGNKALNRIYEMEGPLFFSTYPDKKKFYLPQEGIIGIHSQSLLKDKDNLYIRVDGTGRIFKVLGKNEDTLKIKRIDSTHFFGYNNFASDFIFRDTIFSFGGFGYWRKNGQLRYYSFKNKEWDIIPLNEEIPSSKECTYFDTKKNHVYFLQTPFLDPATHKELKNKFSIYQLDLEKRENNLIGILNLELQSIYPFTNQYISVQTSSLNGELVINNGDKIYLFDFIKNEVYKLSNTAIEKTIFSNSGGVYLDLIFEKNGKLYYTLSNNLSGQLDSI
jgi:hypothetical protein